jgi:hypothetical protein
MSALGQKRTFAAQKAMSALPPEADIDWVKENVRFRPKADYSPLTVFWIAPVIRLSTTGGNAMRLGAE